MPATPIGLSATQLIALAGHLRRLGFLRLPITSQDANGTVRYMLGGKNFTMDVHGNVSLAPKLDPKPAPSAMSQVIQAGISEAQERGVYEAGDETYLALATSRQTNMTGGRHSDSARSQVRSYLANPTKYRADFIAEREGEARMRR